MQKVIVINGMKCEHCKARVQKALNAIPGVEAEVDLKKGEATAVLHTDVPDRVFRDALNELGYEAASITEKR